MVPPYLASKGDLCSSNGQGFEQAQQKIAPREFLDKFHMLLMTKSQCLGLDGALRRL